MVELSPLDPWNNPDYRHGYTDALNIALQWLLDLDEISLAEAMREGAIRHNRTLPRDKRIKIAQLDLSL